MTGIMFISQLGWATAVDAVPQPAETTCRVRHTVTDPEAFAHVVAAQRTDHLDNSFRPDGVYQDLVVDAYIVPTDLSRFIDQPINLGPISGGGEWGYRMHPIYRRQRFHNGLDAAAPQGAPVRAMADGTVAISAYRGGYGHLVAIDHGDGFTTLYAHLSKRDVEVGDEVTAGSTIGRIGSTGASTGPHLHFEVRIAGVPVDPRWFIPVLPTPVGPPGSTREPLWSVAPGGEAAHFQIARLYLAAFDRLPTDEETAHWLGQCRRGVTLEAIALVALGADGVQLDPMTPAELVAISESQEYQDLLASALLQPEVRRLYLAVLGREPDTSGAYHWSSQADRGLTLVELAASLGSSAEYQERFGSRSNHEFVTQLYELVFDRPPDAPGLNYWVEQVRQQGRWSVLVGFTESDEGRARLG